MNEGLQTQPTLLLVMNTLIHPQSLQIPYKDICDLMVYNGEDLQPRLEQQPLHQLQRLLQQHQARQQRVQVPQLQPPRQARVLQAQALRVHQPRLRAQHRQPVLQHRQHRVHRQQQVQQQQYKCQ